MLLNSISVSFRPKSEPETRDSVVRSELWEVMPKQEWRIIPETEEKGKSIEGCVFELVAAMGN